MLYPLAGGQVPTKVFLCNISATGVGLRSTSAIDPGSVWRMKIEAGPLTWSGRVEIRHTRPSKDNRSYDLGATLERVDHASAAHRAGATTVSRGITRNPCNNLRPR